jgi:Fe-S cluster assembly protein SufB
MSTQAQLVTQSLDTYQWGFAMPNVSVGQTPRGLNEDIVRAISQWKKEPGWMTEKRLAAYAVFRQKHLPPWGADLSHINFDDIYYYMKPVNEQGRTWDDVPESMKRTFDRLGIPEAEKKFLAGVGAQYDSEVIYHSLIESLSKQGVIFTDMDTALRDYPEIVKQ